MIDHWNYVYVAFGIFVLALLWDFFLPRFQLKSLTRAFKLRQRRQQENKQ